MRSMMAARAGFSSARLSFFSLLKGPGGALIFLTLALQGLGLVSLYSAAHGAGVQDAGFFRQQIIWLILGWGAFFAIRQMDYFFIKKSVWPLYFAHMAFLAFVLLAGKEMRGVTRWIDLGIFNYQPSETLKIALALALAEKLSKAKMGQPLDFERLAAPGALILAPLSLVLLQPDLGTAGLIFLMLSSLILFQGIKKKPLILLAAIVCLSSPLAWHFALKPYQKSRIHSFLQPGEDPLGGGYNIIQSKIAIGSGQAFGKGFAKGTQNRLRFLPERRADFIFSVLSEEHGFAGSALTLALFFSLIALLLRQAGRCRDRLSCYFCLGSGAFFFWHACLNLSMTMGMFPVVGAPLPLLSYGGSHTLTAMAFLGLAAAAIRRKDLF